MAKPTRPPLLVSFPAPPRAARQYARDREWRSPKQRQRGAMSRGWGKSATFTLILASLCATLRQDPPARVMGRGAA